MGGSWIVALLLIVSSLPAHAQQGPDPFLGPDDLATILADTRREGHPRRQAFETLRRAVDARRGDCPMQALTAFALCFRITGLAAYAEPVRLRLLALAAQAEWESGQRDRKMAETLTAYSMSFDLCREYLVVRSGIASIRRKLARETFKMYQAASQAYNATWQNWWVHTYSQNHFHRNIGSLVFGTTALRRDGAPLAEFGSGNLERWLAFAVEELAKNHAALEPIVDGSWFEGTQYEETTAGTDLPPALYLLRRAGVADHLTTNRWLANVPRFWIYNMNPVRPRHRIASFADGGANWSRTNGLLTTLRLCARLYRDPQAQWAADRIVAVHGRDVSFRGLESAHAIVLEVLYLDASVVARAPQEAWPSSWLAEDLGMAFLRTGWDTGATAASLKCGAYGGRRLFDLGRANYVWSGGRWRNAEYPLGGRLGLFPQDSELVTDHAHPDNAGFTIWSDGVYLAPEAPGFDARHDAPWGRLTSSHNTITVRLPDRDRGQIGEGRAHPEFGEDREEFFQSDGAMSLFAPTARFDLTVADATRCYPRSLGITEFRRYFLFLKPDLFVVVDNLRASAPRRFDWWCHVPDGAVREGNWIQGLADGGKRLGICVVSPAGFEFGTGVRASDGSFEYLDRDPLQPTELHYVRIGVPPAAETRFVTVIQPTTEAAWPTRPGIERLGETADAAVVRATHADGRSDVVMVAYGPATSVRLGAYELNGRAAALRRGSQSEIRSIYVADARGFSEAGRRWVELASTAVSFEASFAGSVVEVSGRGIGSFLVRAPGALILRIDGQTVRFVRSGDLLLRGPEDALTGDADGNGRLQLSDAIAVLDFLYRNGRMPGSPFGADANGDGRLDVSDARTILERLYAR